MHDILLATLNARYIHSSLGLRYVYANLGALQSHSRMVEYTINQRPLDIAEDLLARRPKIIGFGVYIWNVLETEQVIRLIKTVAPEIVIVLGGPEVSYEYDQQSIVQQADVVIAGQADFAFGECCTQLLTGKKPSNKIMHALPFELEQLKLPYDYYTDEDIAHRILYVEASRGCPFKCEFCLSALDKTAVPFDLELFLSEMQKLYDRGAKHFKFVDRTFNLKVESSIRIMEFFLNKNDSALFLHFELIPDHLPERLKEVIARFPPHSLQFEIGIQSLNPDIQTLISRKQNTDKTRANLQWLREHSHAHIHADLIIGLPGETFASFAQGFNDLLAMQPDEIQVGILKRLRGTPIIRHTAEFDMRYNPLPPYNILSNAQIDFATLQRLNRFARYWDMIGNSGRFSHTLPLLLGDNGFESFMDLSDWLHVTTHQTHQIALDRVFALLHEYLAQNPQLNSQQIYQALLADYQRSGLKGQPKFLDSTRGTDLKSVSVAETTSSNIQRQKRHRIN
jgi:radical SAM superfamily enzyme YgiQ (UPF0313 family)